MRYVVVAYRGDAMLSEQPNWNVEYIALSDAVKEAFDRWEWLLKTHYGPSIHDTTLSLQDDCCVLVQDAEDGLQVFMILGKPADGLLDN